MNKEQLTSLIRTLVQMACAGFITKGILTQGDVTTISAAAEIVVPALVAGVTTWYGSIYKRSEKNLVKAALSVRHNQPLGAK